MALLRSNTTNGTCGCLIKYLYRRQTAPIHPLRDPGRRSGTNFAVVSNTGQRQMKFLLYLLTCTLMFSRTAVLGEATVSPAIVYKKALPNNGYISVSKEKTPTNPETIKSLKEWQAKSPPNVTIPLPDYSESYIFSVKVANEPKKIAWFRRVDHYPGYETSEIKVLDATYEAGLFVIVLKLKDPSVIYAAVIQPALKSQKLSFKDNVLVQDSDAFGIYAKSATIHGAALKGTLFIDVSFLGPRHERFDWKGGKWVKRSVAVPAGYTKLEKPLAK